MLDFERGVIERITEVFEYAKGEHEDLGPDGYKIAITCLLGFTPTNWETNEIFKDSKGLDLDQLQEIVEEKLKYFYIEQYIFDMFSTIDTEINGYITLKDVKRAWKFSDSKEPWCKIEEGFREISKDGILEYPDFFEVLINSNIKCKTFNKFKYLKLAS